MRPQSFVAGARGGAPSRSTACSKQTVAPTPANPGLYETGRAVSKWVAVLSVAVGLAAVAGAQEPAWSDDRLASVDAHATTECFLPRLSSTRTFIEVRLLAYKFAGTPFALHGGAFDGTAAVDAGDPRNDVVDTEWVPASWSSSSGILWGRDYAPDAVFEGIVRLLDNRNARVNAYTLSFAPLTPRLVIHKLRSHTGDAWHLLSKNGVIAGVPVVGGVQRFDRIYCSQGMFFLDDAFDARGFIPAKYLR